MSFDRTNMRYELRRADVTEEIQRRQDAEREEQEQQQAQQDAEDAAAAVEIQALLEKAIAEMNCESQTITLTGYTDSAIKLACENMRTPGYSFDGYTYSSTWNVTDYNLSAKSGGAVTLTNKKWAAAEEQRYLDQIDAAIDNREFEVKLQFGDYPDRVDQPWYYASQATVTAEAEGHVTPGGLVSGTDYIIIRSGISSSTNEFTVTIQYALPEMTEEEALAYYIGQIEDAIRNRETEIQFQYKSEGTNIDYHDAIYAAYDRMRIGDYQVDGLAAWEDYRLSFGTSAYDGIVTITITYK